MKNHELEREHHRPSGRSRSDDPIRLLAARVTATGQRQIVDVTPILSALQAKGMGRRSTRRLLAARIAGDAELDANQRLVIGRAIADSMERTLRRTPRSSAMQFVAFSFCLSLAVLTLFYSILESPAVYAWIVMHEILHPSGVAEPAYIGADLPTFRDWALSVATGMPALAAAAAILTGIAAPPYFMLAGRRNRRRIEEIAAEADALAALGSAESLGALALAFRFREAQPVAARAMDDILSRLTGAAPPAVPLDTTPRLCTAARISACEYRPAVISALGAVGDARAVKTLERLTAAGVPGSEDALARIRTRSGRVDSAGTLLRPAATQTDEPGSLLRPYADGAVLEARRDVEVPVGESASM